MTRGQAVKWLESLTKKECAHVVHHSYVNNNKFVWCRSVVAFINHSSVRSNHGLREDGCVDIDSKTG